MQPNVIKNRKRRSGTITMELGLAAPLLMLMMAGAADFARVFYHSITVASASGTGAFYGAQTTVKSADYSSIQTAAANDATDLENVTVTAGLYCDCPDGSAAACLDGDCGAYGSRRVYSKVIVQQTFEPLLPWPGIPESVVATRETYIRVQ